MSSKTPDLEKVNPDLEKGEKKRSRQFGLPPTAYSNSRAPLDRLRADALRDLRRKMLDFLKNSQIFYKSGKFNEKVQNNAKIETGAVQRWDNLVDLERC